MQCCLACFPWRTFGTISIVWEGEGIVKSYQIAARPYPGKYAHPGFLLMLK